MTIVILCVAALLCMLCITVVYGRFWLRGLSVEVKFDSAQINEGDVVQIREKIENRKLLPLPTLTVKFRLDREIAYVDSTNTSRTDKQYRNDCISVMPYQRVVRSFQAAGTKRGFYSVDELDVVAMDLLYRQILTANYDNHTWLYVYPARSTLPRLPEVVRRLYGEVITNRLLWEDPFEFKGIRDYTDSDPMRKINWKSTARTGSLKVNQFYDTSSPRLMVFLNVEQTGVLTYEDLVEESIRIVRNVLEEFIRKGVSVTIISNGVDKLTRQEIHLKEGVGLEHIDACLKQLARMDISGKVRGMDELIREKLAHAQKEQEAVSLLLSVERSEKLAQAYLEYAQASGNATWLLPIHESMTDYLAASVQENEVKRICGSKITTEYLVMERMQ